MAGPWVLLASLALAPLCSGSFFPPILENVSNKTSTFDPRIFVSSKDTSSLCETTPGVKSYSGYVHMPPESLQLPGGQSTFPVNSFYWFFESRKDPKNAPFVLWLGGGPGFSSIISALFENGPCSVQSDSNSTVLNPSSWNNEVNIIYIDSPAMTGYSYDRLVNATVDATNASQPIIPSKSNELPEGNNTLQVGTFGSQDVTQLSNSTGNVVPVIWTAMQAWFANFPQYKPADGRMSIWTESYGGRYGPLTSEFFMQQTQGIQNGTVGENATALTIDTLGLINAYVEPAEHAKSYPAFVNNNTYGIQTVPPEVQASMQQNLTMPGGCLDAITACQSMVDGPDAHDGASNMTSDQACSQAFQLCEATVQLAYDKTSKRDDDDIAHSVLDSFPPEFAIGYLNRAWVQQALGAQVNFTINSATALEAFVATGDLARDGALAAAGRLLDAGVHITMLSGDRDYQVNWFGGEQVSLKVNYTNAQQFQAAGYANMTGTNGTIGGMTRQAGNFSFTRVFQAGHSVPAYQPGIALDIFNRSIHHMDVATGKTSLGAGNGNVGNSSNNVVTTQGQTSIMNVTDKVPPMPLPVCYTWELARTCTPQQQKAVVAGTAMVKDFVVMDSTSSNSTSGSGSPGSGPGAQSAAKSGTGRNAASFALAIALGFMVVSLA